MLNSWQPLPPYTNVRENGVRFELQESVSDLNTCTAIIAVLDGSGRMVGQMYCPISFFAANTATLSSTTTDDGPRTTDSSSLLRRILKKFPGQRTVSGCRSDTPEASEPKEREK